MEFLDFLEFSEFLELGDGVFSFGIFGIFRVFMNREMVCLEFLENLELSEFSEVLELGDGVLSFGFFAIVKCCCVLWNLCCLKRIESTAPAQFSEQLQICHTYSARFWNFGNVDL